MAYVPQRGDIVWLTFNPQAGHEQAGRRPAVVLSPAAYNGKVGLALVCPVPNQQKGYPFEVMVLPNAGITVVILADQLKHLDWRMRQTELIGKLPEHTLSEVFAKLNTLLDV